MCESTVYSAGKSGKTLMKDVVIVTVKGDQIKMRDILGLVKVLRGEIVKIDLLNHNLFIEER